jgi:hypothetical protein
MANVVKLQNGKLLKLQNSKAVLLDRDSLAVFTINTTASPQNFIFYLNTPSNLVVEWGDGTSDTTYTTTGNKTHSYSTAGNYTLKIKSGTTARLAFGETSCTPLRLKAVTQAISASLGLTSGASMFNGCTNCTSWASGFFDAASANLTNAYAMFYAMNTNFNENLGGWNTSNITDPSYMLANCYNFVGNGVGSWNTSKFANLTGTFGYCYPFNQNLANWDVTSVTGAVAFLVGNTALSTANYDATLISWGAQGVKNSVGINFGAAKYSAGAAKDARDHLTGTHSWTITDGGQV